MHTETCKICNKSFEADKHASFCDKCKSISPKYYENLWRNEALDAYGHKCNKCGEFHDEFLTISWISSHDMIKSNNNFGKIFYLKENGWPREDAEILCYNCLFKKKQKATNPLNSYQIARRKTIAKYGNKCACCGETDLDVLQIDHVLGNGNMERKEHNSKSNSYLFYKLAKEPQNRDYRVLCANCNSAIAKYGSCPHGDPMYNYPFEEFIEENHCIVCGKSIQGKRIDAKYCSSKCCGRYRYFKKIEGKYKYMRKDS